MRELLSLVVWADNSAAAAWPATGVLRWMCGFVAGGRAGCQAPSSSLGTVKSTTLPLPQLRSDQLSIGKVATNVAPVG